MTVSSTQVSASYAGNSTTTDFPVPFPFLQTADLSVYLIDNATGVATLQTYGTHYTVGSDAVTMVTAPASTKTLFIQRASSQDQPVDYVAHDTLPAETLERGFDHLTLGWQEQDARLRLVEAALPATPVPLTDTFPVPAAILLLKNTITQDGIIPAGYNGIAVDPVITTGKTVAVATGSEWFIAAPGGAGIGVGGGFASLGADNVFTGKQDFGTGTGSYSARLDPASGSFYINRSGNLAANGLSDEHNGFAADITCSSGNKSIVPLHGHAVSGNGHSGNAWGAAFEAYAQNDKAGASCATQLFGIEASIINKSYLSTAPRHAGLLLPFKNRLDTQDTPVAGVPSGGHAYNINTSAVYIDTGAGRVGSSSDPNAGNSAIECGWNKGIYFAPQSLDSAAGVKAIGIDFASLDTTAPEGGKFTARVQSFVAVPSDGFSTFSTDRVTAQQRYTSGTGTMEFANNGSFRMAVGMGSGTLFMNDGSGTFDDYSKWIAAGNNAPAFASITSNGGKTTAPGNTATPASWVRIIIDGVSGAVPWYR